MIYSSKKAEKEIEKIIENFKKDRNLDEFCQGIGNVAKKLKTDPMLLYMQIARKENLKTFNGHYVCEEVKLGKGNCYECRNFMSDSDKCIGDSIISFAYRILHPDYKPPHFEKNEVILILKK
ncbi:MAG: hypothetical protein QXD43_01890 [Candidatus Aenigmatarchaeota archaeon]